MLCNRWQCLIFHDTILGRILQYVSGGSIFSAAEQQVLSKAEQFLTASAASTPRAFKNETADTSDIQRMSLENGQSLQVVDWEKNDPEVWSHLTASQVFSDRE